MIAIIREKSNKYDGDVVKIIYSIDRPYLRKFFFFFLKLSKTIVRFVRIRNTCYCSFLVKSMGIQEL